MQSVLLGAMHGLERHIAGLFAEWNHKALLQHADELAAALGVERAWPTTSPIATHSQEAVHPPRACSGSICPETPRLNEGMRPGPMQACLAGETMGTDGSNGSATAQLPDAQCRQMGTHTPSSSPSTEGIKESCPLSRDGSQTSNFSLGCGTGQLPDGHAQSLSESLSAILAGLMSPAMALTILAAVHMGAASLGLAAGLAKMPWPLYLISTRDSFTHHLHAERSQVLYPAPVYHDATAW